MYSRKAVILDAVEIYRKFISQTTTRVPWRKSRRERNGRPLPSVGVGRRARSHCFGVIRLPERTGARRCGRELYFRSIVVDPVCVFDQRQ